MDNSLSEQINLYSNWTAVIFMIVVSTLFIFSFIPLRKKNWRALGLTEAFVIALFTEMYGFSLTIYFLSSVLGMKIPFVHFKGHLWSTLFGFGDAGALVEMLIGDLITIFGAGLVIAGWKKIYQAKTEDLVTIGVYSYVRHPQYTGIILAAFGTFIHWPTLPTLIMLPILIAAYYKLAKEEEKAMVKKFGEQYLEYQENVPMFLPLLRKKVTKIAKEI